MLKVYTAASVRHLHAVQMFHAHLRDLNLDITPIDWTQKAVPPPCLTVAGRRAWVDADQHEGQVFNFCYNACACQADLVVYLGESGQDAGVEVGLAYASDIPVLGIRGTLEAPGLMLNGCVSRWVDNVKEALELIARVAGCSHFGEGCPTPDQCPAQDLCFIS